MESFKESVNYLKEKNICAGLENSGPLFSEMFRRYEFCLSNYAYYLENYGKDYTSMQLENFLSNSLKRLYVILCEDMLGIAKEDMTDELMNYLDINISFEELNSDIKGGTVGANCRYDVNLQSLTNIFDGYLPLPPLHDIRMNEKFYSELFADDGGKEITDKQFKLLASLIYDFVHEARHVLQLKIRTKFFIDNGYNFSEDNGFSKINKVYLSENNNFSVNLLKESYSNGQFSESIPPKNSIKDLSNYFKQLYPEHEQTEMVKYFNYILKDSEIDARGYALSTGLRILNLHNYMPKEFSEKLEKRISEEAINEAKILSVYEKLNSKVDDIVKECKTKLFNLENEKSQDNTTKRKRGFKKISKTVKNEIEYNQQSLLDYNLKQDVISALFTELFNNLRYKYRSNKKALEELQDVAKTLYVKAITKGNGAVAYAACYRIPKNDLVQIYTQELENAVNSNNLEFLFDSTMIAEGGTTNFAKLIQLALQNNNYDIAGRLIMNGCWEDLAEDKESLKIIDKALTIKKGKGLSLKQKKKIKELSKLVNVWLEFQKRKKEDLQP